MTERRQALVFFLLTFALSWLGALAVVAPKLLAGAPIGKFDGLMMFPAMLLGPFISGLLLTLIFDGWAGLRDLGARQLRIDFAAPWWLALLIPFAGLSAVLLTLKVLVSPAFAPNAFFPGAGFGLIAGLTEEIGWTGFAFPKLSRLGGSFSAALLLGAAWGLWHLPVIDFLGAATPHGSAWALFALAFVAAMTAMRVLIAWLYANTQSLLAAQALHACSTAALVVLSPQVSPTQEAFWYAIYAAVLWALALLIRARFGPSLRRP